jgi:hypothetical protein
VSLPHWSGGMLQFRVIVVCENYEFIIYFTFVFGCQKEIAKREIKEIN